jgi:hypothetical protein
MPCFIWIYSPAYVLRTIIPNIFHVGESHGFVNPESIAGNRLESGPCIRFDIAQRAFCDGKRVFMPRCLIDRRDVCRQLPQAIPAQAIAAIGRHRQSCGFLGAPAGAGEAAGERRSTAGTNHAARRHAFLRRQVFRRRQAFRICHESNRIVAMIFTPGSC